MMLQRALSNKCFVWGTTVHGKWQKGLFCPSSFPVGMVQTRESVTEPMSTNKAVEKPASVKAFEEMPGPRSLPYIGTLYKYLPFGEYSFRKPHESHMKRFTKYGPIVRETLLPGVDQVHLFDPDDIATVFRNEGALPVRPDVFGLKAYRDARGMSQGLVTLNGEAWQRLRSQVQKKMMRKANAAAYIPVQDPIASEFTNRMRMLRDENGEIPDFLNELYKWAMESIGVVCFDSRLGTLEMDQSQNSEVKHLCAAVGRSLDGIYRSLFLADLYKKIPNAPTMRRLFDNLDYIFSVAHKHIDRSLERFANGEETLIPAEKSLLLSLLANPNLKRDEALSMIADLFLGGIDSTGNTMAFNINNLANNPACQSRLQEEIDEFVPKGTTPTNEILQQMKYLVAVTTETARLTPTTPGTVRKAMKAMVLSGYNIPPGTDIFLGSTVICRRPEYFDEPDIFKPERWLRKQKDDITAENTNRMSLSHRFAVLPFGYGPRMCIGRRFAEQEVWLGLIKVFQEFRVEYKHEPIGYTTRAFNVPDRPLRFTFIDRK